MASTNTSSHPPAMNKKARAKLAKDTINTLIPQILKTNERARTGSKSSQLIRYDPSLVSQKQPAATTPSSSPAEAAPGPFQAVTALQATPPTIRVIKSDTLDAATVAIAAAAAATHATPPTKRSTKPRIVVLNMASPLRPGGGVLNGARAQEESLCLRSTLYASLDEAYYRLPEDAAVYSPDVLVFRSADNAELPKKDWFFLDVISCAALRFPDTVVREGEGAGKGERVYENEGLREAMVMRVRLILQIAVQKGVTHLVLGALGCGAYKNPPGEVARIFRKVICGDRKRRRVTVEESGIEEVVFAIFDEGENLTTFREVFADVAVEQGV